MDPAPDTNLEAKKPGPAPARIPQLANCLRSKCQARNEVERHPVAGK